MIITRTDVELVCDNCGLNLLYGETSIAEAILYARKDGWYFYEYYGDTEELCPKCREPAVDEAFMEQRRNTATSPGASPRVRAPA